MEVSGFKFYWVPWGYQLVFWLALTNVFDLENWGRWGKSGEGWHGNKSLAVQNEFTENPKRSKKTGQIITIILVVFLPVATCPLNFLSSASAAWSTSQLRTCNFSFWAILKFEAAAILHSMTALSTPANYNLTWGMQHPGPAQHSALCKLAIWGMAHACSP